MKYLNILILAIFLNSLALPSIATVFGWKFANTNVTISEEEIQNSDLLDFNHKLSQKILNIHDFLNFKEIIRTKISFDVSDYSAHLSPFLAIFSPPPEA